MAWIALVGPELEENLSLRYLASSLTAAGYTTEILAFNHELELMSVLSFILSAETPPLLVGLSLAFQWRALDFVALAIALREGGYTGHITAGGHFATFADQDLMRDFGELDSICRQEAELTVVSLANALANGEDLRQVAGLTLRLPTGDSVRTQHPPLPDIQTLPWPDRRGTAASCFGHAIAPLVGSRGCYANCTFCCIAAWHEQSLPGKRYRIREPEDIAAEMVSLKKTRGIELFVFHDDNFFVPGHRRNRERFNALADQLEAQGIGTFATIVKARPTDVDREVFRILVERLNCIRCYIGVETDSEQGLDTLQRWSRPGINRQALDIARDLDLYICFNMLLFDPDTTLESLDINLAFMDEAADYPFNFGRVELYAGTPLLHRMQLEGRCRGDYLQYDYDLASPALERIFSLAMSCFRPRNFGADALANRLMGTRFDLEVARFFHPEVMRPEWRLQGRTLNETLGRESVQMLRTIVEHVRSDAPTSQDVKLVQQLSRQMRRTERVVDAQARALANELYERIGRGKPLTVLGDRVATPLQSAPRIAAIPA